jgi:G3E family GTPase
LVNRLEKLIKNGKRKMKIMIIGGFLGSGKTTAILKISRQLRKTGKRTAIIVNEIGEIGLDGDTLTGSDIVTKELTSGCICCTLRISMQYTLQTLEEEFKPEIVIIEPTGIAFPGQIRGEIETMGLSELSFSPVVTLVDPCRFGAEVKEIPRFIEIQIREAEILCINKIDIAPAEKVLSTEEMLLQINPEAEILRFSAKIEDEQFERLFSLLGVPGLKKSPEEKKNSIKLSKVSTFSTLYTLTSKSFCPEKGMQLIQECLLAIRDNVGEINPAFIGHLKLSLKLPEFTLRGSVTSFKELPQVELLDRKNEKIELRLLAAITNVPESKLIEIIERTLEEKIGVFGISFEKEFPGCGHELEPHDEHEKGQMPKVEIYRKNKWKKFEKSGLME